MKIQTGKSENYDIELIKDTTVCTCSISIEGQLLEYRLTTVSTLGILQAWAELETKEKIRWGKVEDCEYNFKNGIKIIRTKGKKKLT